MTTLTDRLVEAAEGGASGAEDLADAAALPSEGGGSLRVDDADRVVATVLFAQTPDESTLSSLAALSIVDEVFTVFPAATIRVDPAALSAVEELPGVLSATPALKPFTGSELRSAELPGASALRAEADSVPTAEAARCSPVPIEADGPLRSAEARERFGADGLGVTVGVISDSFASIDSPTSWADDVASGALPGAANPCGRTAPVEIVSDSVGGSDEGRAMAQLVHGIAPGARILFADAGRNDLEMSMNIAALVEAGADIIVDDITWPQETAYQQGFISGAIEEAKAQGVAYFTSAGNSTGVGSEGESAGRPISSWSTSAYRPTDCPSWLAQGAGDPLEGAIGIDCLDFDPDPTVETPYDTLMLEGEPGDPDTNLRMIGSIAEPFLGITTAYEWRFYRVDPGASDPALIAVVPQLSQYYPGATGAVTAAAGSEIRAVMVRTRHDPAAPEPAVLFSFLRGGDSITSRAHLGDGASDLVGPTTFGHAADGSAVSVASLDWKDPTRVRPYSSLGPATLYFEPVRFTTDGPALPSAPLPSPVVVNTPNLASVDGTQTTFFSGEPGDAEFRFFGTSAAAPNAAAVAALGKSYAPGISGGELTARVLETARGTAEGGPVNPYTAAGIPDTTVFGEGIVDAVGLLEALPVAPATPSGLRATEVTAERIAIEWAPVEGAAAVRAELVPVAAESRIASDASHSLPATATSAVFEGLTADTAYTVRVTAENAVGASRSATLEVRTAAEVPKPEPKPEPKPKPKPELKPELKPEPAPNVAEAPLAHTGGASTMPWLLAGGALLILGAGVVAVVAARSRARARAAESAGADAVGTLDGDEARPSDASRERGE